MKKEIQKYKKQLPDTIQDLQKFILIGDERLVAYKAELRAIGKVGMAKDIQDKAIEDGQRMGTALLFAKAKLGQLLGKIPNKGEHLTSQGGRKVSLPLTITHKQSHYAQELFKNKDLINETIKEAKDMDDIPTTGNVLRKIQMRKREEKTDDTPEMIKGKYRILYADPPWEYGNKGLDEYGHAERHYKTMSIKQLCELPVKDIVQENAVLFLWVTSPFLESSFELINAWGFKYKSSFVWDKIKHNFGYYSSVRHEFLLIATNGSCLPNNRKLFDSVVSIERSKKHSEKPEYFRKLIDKLYTKGKRIELFARKKTKGWDSWGNEAGI